MSLRFNNGYGAITCDLCNVIFISGPESFIYDKSRKSGALDLCPAHWKEQQDEAQDKSNGVSRVRQELQDEVKSTL